MVRIFNSYALKYFSQAYSFLQLSVQGGQLGWNCNRYYQALRPLSHPTKLVWI